MSTNLTLLLAALVAAVIVVTINGWLFPWQGGRERAENDSQHQPQGR